ncbi:MAG: DUF721 domain-containing protein [Pseudomonadota bacterium]
MGKRTKKPLRVGDILKNYCNRVGLNRRMNEKRLLDVWEEAVGEAVAKRTEPMRIKNRILYLKVTNSVWMQQLQFMKEVIVKKLHEKTGIDFLQDIRFFIGEVGPMEKEAKGGSLKRDLTPLSGSDWEQINKEVSGVQDPEMQEILSGLYSKALAVERNQRKKGNIKK